ncbi:uncharacterized protein LOC122851877 isoform X2 [Aphidius gifuensis]|uniref:uncharacterized protein LOC122851877 isoform X2 n=1 Tax=Aphidius gifuensis TaxID=684658 RepID=UPI001CDD230B|nr:uncharacterized protein LOC122851877 isoform X2 [Aphidius gifuensis]
MMILSQRSLSTYKDSDNMWKILILLLCTIGITSGNNFDVQTNNIYSPSINREKDGQDFDGIRRFACPYGFFRLKRNCYHLSAKIARWIDAYHDCRDKNSTLAVLDKKGKDRQLRKYLMSEQFTKLERWIGGIYNWLQMSWKWGETGEKIEFENFSRLNNSELNNNPKEYAWHCIVLDPTDKYKWNPRICLQQKHYICEVPAGRIGRRRKKTIEQDQAPLNQKLKQKKKSNKKYGKNNQQQNDNPLKNKEFLAKKDNANGKSNHGVNSRSRPLSQKKSLTERKRMGTRHQPNRRIHQNKNPIPQNVKQPVFKTFTGDASKKGQPWQLADENKLQQFQAHINDFTREEILLKI